MYERVVDRVIPKQPYPLIGCQLSFDLETNLNKLIKFASFNRALLETKSYHAFGEIVLVLLSRISNELDSSEPSKLKFVTRHVV